jgi:hypothetical protein
MELSWVMMAAVRFDGDALIPGVMFARGDEDVRMYGR